jgi:N-glycosylase/DNA lyase
LTVPIRLAAADGLHLRRTLDSGQTFRWRWEAGGGTDQATGIIGRQVVRIAQQVDGLWLLSPDTHEARRALLRYFGMPAAASARLGTIEAALVTDRVLARIVPVTRGIRLLTQDPWEVLISFIVSQNNNIPKITRSIERLARALGEPLGEGAYAFPAPAALAGAQHRTLRSCLLGYRVPYVRTAARLVAEGRVDLEALRTMPEAAVRETLWALPGVGDKVGECILLFAFGHQTAFPVDVWVKRAVERFYFQGRPRTPKQIHIFARERFGPLAGYAQQHLFAFARERMRS